MVIKISQPKYLNERGKRKNNEDAILPSNPTATDSLFIVCDGVGGAARGEVASITVAQTVYQFMQQHFKRFTSDADVETIIQGAVEAAELALNQYITQNPSAKGMGTTLTLLHLHEGGATIAHVGDSRIYHFRKNQLPYVTEDHSYVNDMVKSGLMTHVQAHNHPHRNVITRAIQGLPERAVRADVRVIKNIQAGDYFLLCTDGVTEVWDDELLSQTVLAEFTDDNKIKAIQTTCGADAQDNFSCFLIPVESVEGPVLEEDHFPKAAFFEMLDGEPTVSEPIPRLPLPNNDLITPFSPLPAKPSETGDHTPSVKKNRSPIFRVMGLLAIAGGAVFAGIQIGKDSNKKNVPVVVAESPKPPINTPAPNPKPHEEKPVIVNSSEEAKVKDTHVSGRNATVKNHNQKKKEDSDTSKSKPQKEKDRKSQQNTTATQTSTPNGNAPAQEGSPAGTISKTESQTQNKEQEAAAKKKLEDQKKAEDQKKLEAQEAEKAAAAAAIKKAGEAQKNNKF